MEDRLLVEALRSRDPAAVGAVYDDYADRLYGYCWFQLRNGDAAQLAFRDTMMSAESHIRELRAPAKLGPWLYALARLECRRRSPAGPVAPDIPVAHHDQDDADLRLMAWQAVTALPPLSRELLDLRYRQELPPSDIALVTGLPLREVDELLGQARVLLEAALIAEVLAHEGPFACPERVEILRRRETTSTDHQRPRRTRRSTALTDTPSRRAESDGGGEVPDPRRNALGLAVGGERDAHAAAPGHAVGLDDEHDRAGISEREVGTSGADDERASSVPPSRRTGILGDAEQEAPDRAGHVDDEHESSVHPSLHGVRDVERDPRVRTFHSADADGQRDPSGNHFHLASGNDDEQWAPSGRHSRPAGESDDGRAASAVGQSGSAGESDSERPAPSVPRSRHADESDDGRSAPAVPQARRVGESDGRWGSSVRQARRTGGERWVSAGRHSRRGGGVDDDQRELLVRHSLECRLCSRHLPDAISPAKVYTLLPHAAPPVELRALVISCFTDPEMAGYRLFAAARVSSFGVARVSRAAGGRAYVRAAS